MKQTDKTSIWGNDKVKVTLFPEVYTKFWFTLDREHPDLMQAMVLAQVKIEDGTAIDFLNTLLGTSVQRNTPMEVGYAQLLDALNMRKTNQASQTAMNKVAEQFKDHSIFPSRSDPTKPLFPDKADQ